MLELMYPFRGNFILVQETLHLVYPWFYIVSDANISRNMGFVVEACS
jgi:hypothetical protein